MFGSPFLSSLTWASSPKSIKEERCCCEEERPAIAYVAEISSPSNVPCFGLQGGSNRSGTFGPGVMRRSHIYHRSVQSVNYCKFRGVKEGPTLGRQA